MRHDRAPWLFLAVLALPPESRSQDLPEIQKRGTLRVIVDASSLPERFALGPGSEPGFEKEILLGFAALQHVKLEVVVTERADERLPLLASGKGDVIAGIVVTDSRRKLMAFTAEVLPARHVVITRRPSPPVSTLAELRAKRVGTMKGTSWAEETAAAGVPRASIDDSYPSTGKILEALASGKVSAAVMTVVYGVVEQKRDPQLQLGLFLGAPTSVAFGVRKESQALHGVLDGYVSNFRKTATWSRLLVKYFGESGLEILKKSRPQ